jgi:hypothetical protein
MKDQAEQISANPFIRAAGSRENSASIVISLRVERPRRWGSISDRDKNVSLVHCIHAGSSVHLNKPYQGLVLKG